MCEIALVSCRKSRLEQQAQNGSKGAKVALKLLEEPAKFLSTIQIGITLVGIFAGAYGAGVFTASLQPYIEQLEILKPYAGEVSFLLIVSLITYFSLIIGELVPKTIALNNPERITIVVAPLMRVLTLLTYPVVAFLSFSTKLFLKALFIKEKKVPPVTEEELKYMIDTGSRHGIIEKEEGEIMQGVIRFADRKAKDVMTKKSDIKWLNITESKENILNYVYRFSSTKYPVCEGSLERIVGVISITDIVKFANGPGTIDFKQYMVEPVFFPENTSTLQILDNFRRKKIHIGFVVNQQGHTLGLITLHDLVESIIGDLPEWNDESLKVFTRQDGSLLLDGDVSMEEVQKIAAPENLPLGPGHKNLADFTAHQLQGIPKTGASFVFGKYRFEIIDMDRGKIDKVLITRI